MEAAAATPVAGASLPTPPTAASPQYTPPPPPPSMQPPMMADGGEMSTGSGGESNKFKEFFSDINVLDVAISAFIVGGVLYAVHYYKFMIMLEKTGYADLSTRIQRVESQVAAAKKSAEANASGNGKMGIRNRKRALVTL